MNVSLTEIIQRWMTADSHEVFEGHLPQLIPLDYIDCVYMPKNIFQSLSAETQKSVQHVFKDSLVITNHDIDLSLIKAGSTVSLDATRQVYQNKPGTTNGIVITTPASKFEEQIVLPVTISQSRILYCLDRAQTSHNLELIYIYWQAMNGDLILTISNETINPEKDQTKLRCLVCYIAEKPSTTTDDYHEVYSYLNDDNPYQHETNIYTNEFKAKSNVFYRGCNADDFLTFCLKINHNSGKGILSHAGPNGTYNHETIEYQFDKSELDLSQIDFIHVNAGNQDVPIRNFTINHEPILELHPSSDNDFKLGT
ncbi:unnamed protein product [Rotaria magnacalcarata]|uniref:Uncharacterized protein n=1 Tax=Rotaria magnacalcarata TaxID=392030 RepID=A0A816PQD7_9BILA|nr:unnamed protein product [Rotaria magnacalcarata]CAF4263577.1 unnamed protein product [Rotaria magnacalcarata]